MDNNANEPAGIQIAVANPSHYNDIMSLIANHFVTREPICVSSGLSFEEAEPTFSAIVNALLAEPHSFVALDTANGNRVIGCRLSKHLIDDDNAEEEDFLQVVGHAPTLERISCIFNKLMHGWTKALPKWKSILEFVTLCIDEKYGGRGIAQRLVNRSLMLARELDVDYVFSVATNIRSQRIFDKNGFEAMRTLRYEEVRDENGTAYLSHTDGSTSVKWMVKNMRE